MFEPGDADHPQYGPADHRPHPEHGELRGGETLAGGAVRSHRVVGGRRLGRQAVLLDYPAIGPSFT